MRVHRKCWAACRGHPRLGDLRIANNDITGNLYTLADLPLLNVQTASNPGLCGMVPASVRHAHGYNSFNTSLGKPCPGETYPPKLAQR